MYFFSNVTKIWILRDSYQLSAKTYLICLKHKKKQKLLQSFQNSSLVVLDQNIFKAWCSVTNDKCKVNEWPNSIISQYQQEYKVKPIHSGFWWSKWSVIVLTDYGVAKKLYVFITFSHLFFLFFFQKQM